MTPRLKRRIKVSLYTKVVVERLAVFHIGKVLVSHLDMDQANSVSVSQNEPLQLASKYSVCRLRTNSGNCGPWPEAGVLSWEHSQSEMTEWTLTDYGPRRRETCTSDSNPEWGGGLNVLSLQYILMLI
jgi:hypothetical protein